MENQKRLRRISAHSGKGQLADCPADGCSPLPAALAVAAEHGKPLCGWEEFFFQIAAFLLREGGGVSPSTLECRLI